MTTDLTHPDPVVLEQALAEAIHDMRRLELERWTRYETDPDVAIRKLIRREQVKTPAQVNHYKKSA